MNRANVADGNPATLLRMQRKMQILCSDEQLLAWKVEAAREGLSLQRFVVALLDREVARRKARRAEKNT